jgi:hypothetical protein
MREVSAIVDFIIWLVALRCVGWLLEGKPVLGVCTSFTSELFLTLSDILVSATIFADRLRRGRLSMTKIKTERAFAACC